MPRAAYESDHGKLLVSSPQNSMKQLVITLDPNYNLSLKPKKPQWGHSPLNHILLLGLATAIKGPSADWGSAAQLLQAAGTAVLLPSGVTTRWPTCTSFAAGQQERSLCACACAISQRITASLWVSPGFISFVVRTAALGMVLGVGERTYPWFYSLQEVWLLFHIWASP